MNATNVIKNLKVEEALKCTLNQFMKIRNILAPYVVMKHVSQVSLKDIICLCIKVSNILANIVSTKLHVRKILHHTYNQCMKEEDTSVRFVISNADQEAIFGCIVEFTKTEHTNVIFVTQSLQ